MTGQQWTMAAGITAAFALLYYASLRLYPYTKCRWCDGKSRVKAWAPFGYAFRPCHRCSGRGRKQRLGARILGYGEPRQKQSRWAKKNRR
jgi:hypothetical protein